MIEKLDLRENVEIIPIKGSCHDYCLAKSSVLIKINELVDAVNKLETMAKNTNTVLESLVQENNIHEKQIDELQMKLEPEKCGTPSENVQPDAESRPENVHAVCPAVKYMGKVCRFWNGGNGKKFKNIGVLIEILSADNKRRYTCASKPKKHFEFCEPVKPEDDIIYKGE